MDKPEEAQEIMQEAVCNSSNVIDGASTALKGFSQFFLRRIWRCLIYLAVNCCFTEEMQL